MNILTFDIEEWFHILDNESTKSVNKWNNFEVRIYKNMDRIFEMLDMSSLHATFFCMGWIAEKYPDIIKDIVRKGYEIGSHSYFHQLVYEQSAQTFKKDTEKSIQLLEDITGEKVKYFRAPGFSITGNEKWAFEILSELGIEVDSSVFPVSRGHGGFPSYGVAKPSIIKYGNQEIKELPINITTFLGKAIIFSGGGYFRLLPYRFIKKFTQKSDYVMTYFHPRDFDAKQPLIKDLPINRKFKSYYGLRSARNKFQRWIKEYDFIDIKSAVDIIDWEDMPVIKL